MTLPWYIAGPLIGLSVPALLILREKQLGVSSSLRVVGSYLLPKVNYFNYQRLKDYWQIQFGVGILIASLVAFESVETTNEVYSMKNWFWFLIGGFSIGFGARYANGCTAGHSIMGNALFSLSSLITTLAFFIGGILATYFINPFIF